MHQIVCRLGLCPRPHWGSIQCFPRPHSCIELATSNWEEGRDRAEDGTGGRGRGAEREGPERKGERRAPMTLWHGAPNVLIRPCADRRRVSRSWLIMHCSLRIQHFCNQLWIWPLKISHMVWIFFCQLVGVYHVTLNTCTISAITWSTLVQNFSKINQTAAEL